MFRLLDFRPLRRRRSEFLSEFLSIQQINISCSSRDGSSQLAYVRLLRASSTPLELAKICRNIHAILTGSKAARRAQEHYLVDANGMREIWRDLDQCWQELDSMLCSVPEGEDAKFDVSQYVHGWQVSGSLYLCT